MMKWLRATPIGSSGAMESAPLPELTVQILDLLARGKSDESVAVVIGKNKSTVQRQLEPAEELLGLKPPSRFELGFAVGRSSLLGNRPANQDGKEHHA
jgi:DNA-binding NarL/FixJ family response regulator